MMRQRGSAHSTYYRGGTVIDLLVGFEQQINIAPLLRVVYPRAKEDDPRVITQHRMGGLLDGCDLVLG
jgi:hypothetical protein